MKKTEGQGSRALMPGNEYIPNSLFFFFFLLSFSLLSSFFPFVTCVYLGGGTGEKRTRIAFFKDESSATQVHIYAPAQKEGEDDFFTRQPHVK